MKSLEFRETWQFSTRRNGPARNFSTTGTGQHWPQSPDHVASVGPERNRNLISFTTNQRQNRFWLITVNARWGEEIKLKVNFRTPHRPSSSSLCSGIELDLKKSARSDTAEKFGEVLLDCFLCVLLFGCERNTDFRDRFFFERCWSCFEVQRWNMGWVTSRSNRLNLKSD